ncbi:MAG TPA: efflux RND transporter periplasmic adaptor subunit [Campylobacterales bacterium]|nr:efflux RND transporter periplasmic adaptor subunit [Campylobacterales bacterium]HIO70688.1 efflux RND transporter periplasmic adaptor subunit [Campylobacterales bacterium]
MKKFFAIWFLAFSWLSAGLTISGTVISDNEKVITSRYMGFVTEVNAFEGDYVKKGQLLYSIDSKEIDSAMQRVQLGISQAQLSLQMNQNQLNNLRLNLARHKRLFKKNMVSKYEVEMLELATKNMQDMVEISKKQVEQANQQLEELKNQYKYLHVKAPNDGVVIRKSINAGELALPGMPAFVISDLNHLRVIAEINENDLKMVKIGKEVIVEVPSMEFIGKGKVISIVPNSNPMTHTFKIKVKCDKMTADSGIFPGMYATITIE